MSHRRGFTTISWSLPMMNKEMLYFAIKTKKFFPLNNRLMLLIDSPMQYILLGKTFSKFIDKNLDIKYVSSEELKEYVDGNIIPIEKGGKRYCRKKITSNMKSLNEMHHFNIPPSVLEDFQKTYQSFKEKL